MLASGRPPSGPPGPGRDGRPRRQRWHRRLQGGRGLPPARRRRGPRRPGAHARRRPASSAPPPSRRWPASPRGPSSSATPTTRSRTPTSASAPTSSSWRRRPPASSASTPLGSRRDLLGATLLATRAPVLLCPAMHTEMWEHPAVQENLATLRRRGVMVLEPDAGRLAGGDVGAGRLAEPAAIVAARQVLAGRARGNRPGGDLAGRTVLVTAGGTREPIDPVRFLANRSSGKQGHALAEVAAARGARSPSSRRRAPARVRRASRCVEVETAAEMHEAVLARARARRRRRHGRGRRRLPPERRGPRQARASRGRPRDRPRADRRHPRRARAAPPSRARCSSASRPRRRRGATSRATSSTRKGVDLLVVNDVERPGRRLRARHQRGRRARATTAPDCACRSARSLRLPRPCSTSSSPAVPRWRGSPRRAPCPAAPGEPGRTGRRRPEPRHRCRPTRARPHDPGADPAPIQHRGANT